MPLENLKNRDAVLQELYAEEKRLSLDPAVIEMRTVRDLIRILEPKNLQLEIPFDEGKKTKTRKVKNGSVKKYPDISQVVTRCMEELRADHAPDEFDYLESIVDLAAGKYQVSGKKTLAHFRTCVYACLNSSLKGKIEVAQDEAGKRIYKLK